MLMVHSRFIKIFYYEVCTTLLKFTVFLFFYSVLPVGVRVVRVKDLHLRYFSLPRPSIHTYKMFLV